MIIFALRTGLVRGMGDVAIRAVVSIAMLGTILVVATLRVDIWEWNTSVIMYPAEPTVSVHAESVSSARPYPTAAVEVRAPHSLPTLAHALPTPRPKPVSPASGPATKPDLVSVRPASGSGVASNEVNPNPFLATVVAIGLLLIVITTVWGLVKFHGILIAMIVSGIIGALVGPLVLKFVCGLGWILYCRMLN